MTQISPNDIQFYLSAPGASAGLSVQGSAGNSSGSGKFISTSQLQPATNDNLFPDITGAQNAANQIDYVCLFVLNNTASGNSMLNTVAWIPSSSDAQVATKHFIGLDPAGITNKSSGTAQAAVTTSATQAPSGVNFVPVSSSPSGGVSVGTVPPGDCFALWFMRKAQNSAPLNSDGFTVEIDLDTQG